jgi:U3 small nucleolar ribonucleoprotein component
MKVRAGLQREVEQYCNQIGIPTRTEIDAAHRKIVQLERELRRMRDVLHERPEPGASTASAAKANANTPKATKAKPGSKAPANRRSRP